MAEQCFKKEDSNPPVCGTHDVQLTTKHLPDEMIAAWYKPLTFLACPVSGAVLNDEKKRRSNV
jgi:hypothetical protein